MEADGRIDVPIATGPEPVFGLLSDIDAHRVRTDDLPSLSQLTNVGRRQSSGTFNPSNRLPRPNGREGDLEVGRLGARPRILQLSPKCEGLPDENFRPHFISAIADGCLPFDLSDPTDNQNRWTGSRY